MLTLAHTLSAVSPALADYGSFSNRVIFLPFLLLFGVAGTIFWIWMLVDCARRLQAGEKDKLIWLIVVALTHVLGAIIYFLAGRTPPTATTGAAPSASSPGSPGMHPLIVIILVLLVAPFCLLLLPTTFKLGFGFAAFFLTVLSFAGWVWMLVDCCRRIGSAEDKDRTTWIIWLLVLIFTYAVGALVYYLVNCLGQKPAASSSAAKMFNEPFRHVYGETPPPVVPGAPPSQSPPQPPPPVSPQPTNRSQGQCPKCGTALGPDAPEGLCPRCLLQMNLGAPTQFPGVSAASFATPPPPPPPSIEEIGAHFPQLEILECLGRGGMGVVYKARQPRLNRIVALKILAPGRQQDPQFAERFLREAQALAKLNHPNIVTVFDFGESEGLYYLLMEFVDGVTLRGLLHGSKIESAQALAIVPRICEALQYAHEQGVVHRDIKPENVLIDKQGRVKIADFGIARMLGVEGQPAHTRDRYVIGTPYYMAPEQVEHPLEVDHRADIYSLGVVFYEMLTGELPLGRFALPSQKVTVDVRLDDVVLRALEKEPQRRYQQAGQVKTDVETISGGGTGNLAAAVAAPPHTPSPPRPPTGTTGGAAAVPAGEPRFSGKAIAGLIWVALGLVAFAVMANVPDPYSPHFVPVWLFAIPCLITPLGTTILGWMAVGDIIRSQGKICGLWLAMVDGLLFPLVAVDALITLLCYFGVIAAWGSSNEPPDRYLALFGMASVVFSLFADLIIIWFAVGAVRRARQAHAGSATQQPATNGWWGFIKALLILFFFALITVGLALIVWFVSARTVRVRYNPSVSWSTPVNNVETVVETDRGQLQEQLQQAQQEMQRVQQQVDAGLATQLDLIKASGKYNVLQAQADGQPDLAAQAEADWQAKAQAMSQQMQAAGLVPPTPTEVAPVVPLPPGYNAPAPPPAPPSYAPSAATSPAMFTPPTAVQPPKNDPLVTAEREDASTAAEIAAIGKLDFENNRLAAFINIARRANLSPASQVRLVEATFNNLDFENNKITLLQEIIKQPSFSEQVRAAILTRLSSLSFENNRMTILALLNQRH